MLELPLPSSQRHTIIGARGGVSTPTSKASSKAVAATCFWPRDAVGSSRVSRARRVRDGMSEVRRRWSADQPRWAVMKSRAAQPPMKKKDTGAPGTPIIH